MSDEDWVIILLGAVAVLVFVLFAKGILDFSMITGWLQ